MRVTVSSSGFFRTLNQCSYNLSLILYIFFFIFFWRIEVIRSG